MPTESEADSWDIYIYIYGCDIIDLWPYSLSTSLSKVPLP